MSTQQTNPNKTLAVAVDFGDNVSGHEPSPNRMYTPDEVVGMIQYFHDLGVRRLYWFHDDFNELYEKPFGGADNLLAFACDAAHNRDMTVLSVIKPFETGIQCLSIPQHLTPSARATKTNQGWHVFASQFAANHPEMRLQFRPKNTQPPGSGIVRRIRLLCQDDKGASLRPEDIEIMWSDMNSYFRIYDGPRTVKAHTLQENDGMRRVLEWEGLDLTKEARYILLRYSGKSGDADFMNTPPELLELYDETGKLESHPDQGTVPVKRQTILTWCPSFPPETKAVIEDPEQFEKALKNHFVFEDDNCPHPPRVMNQAGGYICHCLDFNTHVAGALHPGYSQVREYWLERVQKSLDSGVDGVALRIENHSSWCTREEDAGFNEPALTEYARRTGSKPDPATADLDMIRKINGDFYTRFLRESSKLAHKRDKRLEHFLSPMMDGLVNSPVNNCPKAFRFDYRQWLREGLLDGLCLRQHFRISKKNQYFGDMIGAQARLFNVDIFYANQNGPFNSVCVHNRIPEDFPDELKHVHDSELFDGFILYEAAGIMGFDEDGRMHTSTNLERCLEENWK